MKKIQFIVLMLTLGELMSIATTAQNHWSVGGPAGVDGVRVFTTLAEALAEDSPVQNGDTLYIAPGVYSEPTGLEITKSLKIYGPGYFLDENDETQANPQEAEFENASVHYIAFRFEQGSQGSILAGLKIGGRIEVNTNDITIRRNLIFRFAGEGETFLVRASNGIENFSLEQNYIYCWTRGSVTDSRIIFIGSENSNVVIRNNFVSISRGALNSNYCLLSTFPSSDIQVTNNILIGSIEIAIGTFTNNILLTNGNSEADDTSFQINSGSVDFNLCDRTQLPEEGNNQNNVDMTAVFVGPIVLNSSISFEELVPDRRWLLKEEEPPIINPAKGSGLGDQDIGMFGGEDPYRLSGLPSIPAVYSLEKTSSNANSIIFEVKVKSHN